MRRGLSAVFLAGCAIAASTYGVKGDASTWTPAEGVEGWTGQFGTVRRYFPTPAAACAAMFDFWAGGTRSVYRGYYDGRTWKRKGCDWDWKPGGAYGQQPIGTSFECAYGYTAQPPGQCVKLARDRSQPEERCAARSASPGAATGNPIELWTGAKLFEAVDYAPFDRTLRLTRRHVSIRFGADEGSWARGLPSALNNWTFDFGHEFHLRYRDFIGTQIGTLLTPSGSAHRFQRTADGGLIPFTTREHPTAQQDYRLRFLGEWPADLKTLETAKTRGELRGSDDRVWTLETFPDPQSGAFVVAKPVQVRWPEGDTLTLIYGAQGELRTLIGAGGGELQVDWVMNTKGQPETIASIALPEGRRLVYEHTTSFGGETSPFETDRLSRVSWLNAAGEAEDSTSYAYEDHRFPTFITGLVDHAGLLRWKVAYDNTGAAVSSEGPGGVNGEYVAYSLGATGPVATVRNAFGRLTTYSWSQRDVSIHNQVLASVDGAATENCPATQRRMTYSTSPDPFGRARATMTGETDPEGRTTTYARNARGEPTRVVEASGSAVARARDISWHPTLNRPLQVTTQVLRTDYAYDPQGRLDALTLTDLTPHGGGSRTWTYGWSERGLLVSIDGPLAGAQDVTGYGYDDAGRLLSVTNAAGHITTVLAWDGRGAPVRLSDPNGSVTALSYDIRGRVLSAVLDANGEAAGYGFEYDVRGNLRRLTRPGGGFLQYTRDEAERLVQISNERGETVEYTPNLLGDPTRVVVRDSGGAVIRQQSHAYDELGRLLRTVGAGGHATSYGYDRVGNVVGVTDGRGKLWSTAWDALDRAAAETDPDAGGAAAVLSPGGAELDLRLPGQELMAETGGLHQNWMRAYDPTLGRYVEADPLGLEAGQQQLYGYVDGDPLSFEDPLGMSRRTGPRARSALPGLPVPGASLPAGAWRPEPGSPAARAQWLGTTSMTPAVRQAAQADIAGICLGSNQPGAGLQGPRYVRGALRETILKRDAMRCVYCSRVLTKVPGRPDSAQIDHVTPYSRGGSSTLDNLAASCPGCNSSKGANTPLEWIRR